MSKFINKVNRNWAFKNLGLEFLSSLIDDDSEGDDSEGDDVEVGSVDDDSEGDDVEVGSVDDEGINKMYEDFDDRETLLNRCKGLMELIKNKLKGFNGAFCLPPQDGVVEKDAPELVFNIMKTTGTDFVLGGAQPEIATLEVDEPKVKFKEHDSMVGALVNPKKPFAAIIGGSKMSSKIGLIEYLLAKLDMLILGGGTFFTFYKAMGYSVGSSLVEEDKLDLATSLLQKVKAYKILLLLPIDLVIADKYAADANSKIVTVSEDRPSIPDGWMGLDIGPDSVGRFSENLDSAETVIWNGPMGVVEFEKFAVGTKAIVTKLAKLSSRMGVRTFIGGGDSIAVVEKAGLVDRMIYKSTGGTVGLELLVELADKTC